MKRQLTKIGFAFLIVLGILLIYGVVTHYDRAERKYYSDKSNFVTVTAEVTYIRYHDDGTGATLAVMGLPEGFSDNNFKIVGQNWIIAEGKGIREKLHLGDEITFVTASGYFGDGYIMPIAALTIGDEIVLEFEQGYLNFMEWLEE